MLSPPPGRRARLHECDAEIKKLQHDLQDMMGEVQVREEGRVVDRTDVSEGKGMGWRMWQLDPQDMVGEVQVREEGRLVLGGGTER